MSLNANGLRLPEDGAQIVRHPLTDDRLAAVEAALAGIRSDRAGVRLHGLQALTPLLRSDGPIGGVAGAFLGPTCFPVRAILFDKTAATNWALGWHQDRTIAVHTRHDVPGFGPWTVKQGLTHVAPPVAVLAAMVTLRLHLDPVPATNAPLLIARGSHRLGMVAETAIDAVVDRSETIACLAERGDVWAYSTLILHASATAAIPAHRRVLQIDYARDPLPKPLEWLGI